MKLEDVTKTEAKAIRLVTNDRVKLYVLTDELTVAEVTGDNDTYSVTLDPEGKTCTCPHGEHHSPAARCSHVLAVALAIEYGKENS